jgi:hypothetical protein
MTVPDAIAAPETARRRSRLIAPWRVVDYAFMRWRTEKGSAPEESAFFHYHQGSTTLVLYWAALGSAILEIPILHLIVRHWSHAMAWSASVLGIAAIIYLVALIKGVYLRPVILGPRQLQIRLGIQNEISIPLERVLSVRGAGTTGSNVIRLYKADAPNIRVTFDQGNTVAAVDFFVSEPGRLLSLYGRRHHQAVVSPDPAA